MKRDWKKTCEVAGYYGVAIETVRAWINAGELMAINIAPSRRTRPKWRIRPEDLLAFEALRSCRPAGNPKAAPRRRSEPEVIEFFK